MTLSWVANRTAAIPAKKPSARKASMTVRRCEMPERRAASGLPPTA
jgi:hypothetical protein